MWKWLRALRNRGADDSRPLPYVDPLKAGRHPFQIYMLSLCVVAGAPYLFGYATAEAVEKQLPVFIAVSWGLMLFTGAVIALVGSSFWRGSIANALTLERVGLGMTGGAAVVYSLCILAARSGIAPVLVVGIGIGYFLLRIPVSHPSWSKQTTQRVADLLSGLGLALIVGNLVALLFTPALVVLVGAFVILGFGLSCITRARDIAHIFERANEQDSKRILREAG